MIKINNILSIAALLLTVAGIAACEKNTLRTTETLSATDKAYTKFYFLSPGTPAVMVKINDVKINGSNTSGFGGVFPANVLFPDYSATAPGGSIKMSLPNVGTSNDSVVVFSGSLPTAANKYYSVTLADTGVDRTLFTIEDPVGDITDSGFYKLRFINAMGKSPAVSIVRIDSASATVVTRDTIIKNIVFKSASDFVRVPVSARNAFYRYRMIISATGVSFGTNLTPTQGTTINQRYVTLYAGGFVNGTVAPFLPILSVLVYNK